MSSPPLSILLSSLQLRSHPYARPMHSGTTAAGHPYRKTNGTPLSPIPHTPPPSTFSNWLCLLMLGRRRRYAAVTHDKFTRIKTLIQISENSRLSSQVASSLENITDFLTHRFPTASGNIYPDICYSTSRDQDGETTCFTSTVSDIPRSESLTLSFTAGSRRDFVNTLAKQATLIRDDFGPIKYLVENPEHETVSEMKSGKWVVYAARTLVVRFWDLAKVSASILSYIDQV